MNWVWLNEDLIKKLEGKVITLYTEGTYWYDTIGLKVKATIIKDGEYYHIKYLERPKSNSTYLTKDALRFIKRANIKIIYKKNNI